MLSSASQAQEAGGKRLALVIGNSAYASLPKLKNAVSDARLIRKSLTTVGFDVQFVEDADKEGFEQSLGSFAGKIEPGSVVVVYFAGHGFQANNENYLVPVDAKLTDALDLPNVTVSARQILDQVEKTKAAAVIFILDACRDNPFEGKGAKNIANSDVLSTGLARIAGQNAGTLIAFSTSPGAVARDGAGENGPYSEALAASLVSPGQSIETVFKQTRARVVVSTAGEQVPWESSSLVQDVMLVPKPGGPVAIVADACDLAAGHPSDPERVGPSVEYSSLDPQIAIPACEKAIKAHPDNVRFKTLLARALDKAGRGEEAAVLNKIAIEAGYLGGYHNMGNLYRKGLGVEKDLEKAFELYMYAAERGHPEDQSNIGVMYMQGSGVAEDYKLALEWLTKASEQNWATAHDKIGLLYLNGWGVEKDTAKAFEEFGKGANLGNAPAMVNYANSFRKGVGTDQNFKKAYRLYMQAANLGATPAFVNLGVLSAEGKGTEKDLSEAAFWFTLASRDGNEEAQKKLQAINGQLSDEQKQDLGQRLEEWSRQRFG
ncbi:MAG: caspase family protein [Pseudaminobacter sp.]|nr:caspase family protein [Pseudaminobacter sp.]